MELKEVEEFFSEILGRPEYIQREVDLVSKDSNLYGINNFPISFYNLLYNKILIRMARILQNGNNIYIFNRSNHTRLEHSKGVYSRTLEVLMTIYKDEELRKFVRSKGYYKYFVALLARALLHDIGHGPFSHTMELVCNLPKGFHEDIGERLINEDEELRNDLNAIYPNLPELIKKVKEINFLGLNRLFEGEFDVDRGDFLSRDSSFVYETKEARKITKITSELFQNFYIGKVKDSEGKYMISPVFKKDQMNNIENFLKQRFYNYRNIYYHPKSVAYEYIFKEFAKVLLERGETGKLKNYFLHNVNKKPEEVDLREYINFNDIEYLREVFNVAINTKDEELRSLAALSLPSKDMIVGLYYGLMVSWEQMNINDNSPNLSENDIEFLNELGSIKDSNSKLAKLLIGYPFEENCFVLESDLKSDVTEIEKMYEQLLGIKKVDFQEIGLISWERKISLYKGKKEECIYIESSDGNVYEYSVHPERKEEIMEFTKNGFFVMIPKLRQMGYKDSEIKEIKKVISDYNKSLKSY